MSIQNPRIECCVCKQRYGCIVKVPMVISCGHGICSECFMQMERMPECAAVVDCRKCGGNGCREVLCCPTCKEVGSATQNVDAKELVAYIEVLQPSVNADQLMVQHNEPAIKIFKILIIGDGKTGKTTFATRCLQGKQYYIQDLDVDINTFIFFSEKGEEIHFNVWDRVGVHLCPAALEGFCKDAHGVIIMFDTTVPLTYNSIPLWYNEFKDRCGDIPFVLVGNKVDVVDRQVKAMSINFHRENNIMYCDTSALANYNLDKIFLFLARNITNDPNMEFRCVPRFREAQAFINPVLTAQYDKELEQTGVQEPQQQQLGDG